MLFKARLSCVSHALSYLTMEFLFYHRQCKHASTSPWSPKADRVCKPSNLPLSSPRQVRFRSGIFSSDGATAARGHVCLRSTSLLASLNKAPMHGGLGPLHLHLHLTRGKPMTARESSSFQLLPVFLLITGDHPPPLCVVFITRRDLARLKTRCCCWLWDISHPACPTVTSWFEPSPLVAVTSGCSGATKPLLRLFFRSYIRHKTGS